MFLQGSLFDGCVDAVVVAEVLADLLVTAQTQSADKDCHGDLAVLIDADIEHIIGVVFRIPATRPRFGITVELNNSLPVLSYSIL